MTDSSSEDLFDDPGRLADHLQAKGLSRPAAQAKAGRFGLARDALPADDRDTAGAPLRAFFVPGRIEVMGKHTDYAGGSSIVAAAEQGFCLVARPSHDEQITATDAASGETVDFRIDPELVPRAGHWSNYPMTVARRIARNFPAARRGARIAFAGDLPPAAGMSSSSAMMVAFFLALGDVNELSRQPEYRANIRDQVDLAGYLGTVENGQTFGALTGDRGVGTFGGSEDHTAILCSQSGKLSQYAYCPVRFQRVIPLPHGYTFAIGNSGVAAQKTGEAMEQYNTASRLAAQLAEIWRQHTGRDDPHLAAALASGPEAMVRLAGILHSLKSQFSNYRALVLRLLHFSRENEMLVPAAAEALARGDLQGFGQWVDQSQRRAERYLGNQIGETIYLAAAARSAGAAAASAFGAGFGGSVWALVEEASGEEFLSAWAESYRARFPEHTAACSFFLTSAGPAAFRVC